LFEVIVDHKTGKISKVEPITEADDLKDAKKQANAMAKAKSTLADAVAKAVKANSGYRAVSAGAESEGGAANADVGLVKGSSSKNVDEKLCLERHPEQRPGSLSKAPRIRSRVGTAALSLTIRLIR